jgi:hypothetical protein
VGSGVSGAAIACRQDEHTIYRYRVPATGSSVHTGPGVGAVCVQARGDTTATGHACHITKMWSEAFNLCLSNPAGSFPACCRCGIWSDWELCTRMWMAGYQVGEPARLAGMLSFT